jgi:hypothetical protein
MIGCARKPKIIVCKKPTPPPISTAKIIENGTYLCLSKKDMRVLVTEINKFRALKRCINRRHDKKVLYDFIK